MADSNECVPTTHAERHPQLPLQPIVERPKKWSLNEHQRVALEIGKAVAQEKRAKLNQQLLDFLAEQDKKLEAIVQEENVTFEHCRTLLSTSLKKKRKENSQNALVSLKAFELNADQAPGQKLKLKDIQQAVKDDEAMQNASEEEIAKVKELLNEKREAQAQGARATHASEARDILLFMCHMGSEFYNLHQRTGAVGFGFVTRADVDCTRAPAWWACRNATEFAVTSSASFVKAPSNINDRKKACASIILSNRCYITRSNDTQMSYANYERDIVVANKIHLIGWPQHIPFAAPSTLT
ncbi:hypothetical protein C8J56DRAFT_1037314 [Mycena floridula]|nr:hypothetical protein C8J56DRAFT_1037314 [Mycena floridula]